MKKGDLLISFGVDAMKAAGYPCTASMIACSIDGCQRVKPIAEGAIRSGTAVREGKPSRRCFWFPGSRSAQRPSLPVGADIAGRA